MLPPKIRTRIAELRKRSGLTQAELAARLDMTVDGLANWERGRINFRHLETIIKLCDVFDCRAQDLIENCSIFELEDKKPIEPQSLQEIRTMLGTGECATNHLEDKQEAQE